MMFHVKLRGWRAAYVSFRADSKVSARSAPAPILFPDGRMGAFLCQIPTYSGINQPGPSSIVPSRTDPKRVPPRHQQPATQAP